MVFNHILLFAAVITLHTFVIISLGKASFQFLLEISTEALLHEFEPMQQWPLKQKLLEYKVWGCFPAQVEFASSFRCPGKMADDIDIEAMLEAPYKKVRKNASEVLFTLI